MVEDHRIKLTNDLRKIQHQIITSNHIIRHKDYPINGSFSFIKYTEHCIKRIKTCPNEESTQVLELLIKISQFLLQNINKTGQNGDPVNLKMWIDFFNLMTAKNHCLLKRNFGLHHFRWNGRLAQIIFSVVCHEDGLMQSLWHVVRPKSKIETGGNLCEHGTQRFFKSGLDAVNQAAVPVEMVLKLFTPVSKTYVSVPRINDCEIYLDQMEMTRLRINPLIKREAPLRAKVLKIKGQSSPKNSLIFHIQGGGGQNLVESSYVPMLRFINQTIGIPAISVDYRLIPDHPYPASVQDMVDSYLFITSGSQEVKDIIGFIPENIILSGDSAGGYLSLAMLKMLTEMESQLGMGPFMKPTCMSFQFPVIMQEWNIDSLTFSLLDTILPFSTFMFIKSDFFGMTHLKPGWMRRSDDLKYFFHRYEGHFHKDEMRVFGLKGRLDFLKGIKCSLICGEYDPLLDASVALSSIYPEESFHALDVAFRSTHGFMAMELSFNGLKYCNLIPYRIAQMMDIPVELSLEQACVSLIQEQKDEFSKINQMAQRNMNNK